MFIVYSLIHTFLVGILDKEKKEELLEILSSKGYFEKNSYLAWECISESGLNRDESEVMDKILSKYGNIFDMGKYYWPSGSYISHGTLSEYLNRKYRKQS